MGLQPPCPPVLGVPRGCRVRPQTHSLSELWVKAMPSQKDRKSVLIPSSFPMARGISRQRSGCRGTMQRWALLAILLLFSPARAGGGDSDQFWHL